MPGTEDYRLYLEERFSGILTNFHAHFENINDKLDEIIAHQKITNGRVTKTEERVDSLEGWRDNCSGAESQKVRMKSVIITAITIIISLASLSFYVYNNNKKTVEKVVRIVDQYGFEMVTRSADYINDTIK